MKMMKEVGCVHHSKEGSIQWILECLTQLLNQDLIYITSSNYTGFRTIKVNDTNYYLQHTRDAIAKNCFLEVLIIAEYSGTNNKQMNRMCVLTANTLNDVLTEMDTSDLQENAILELNRKGRRWKGGLLHNRPFGYGCEFSKNGNLVYEGFMFNGDRVCVGKEFHDNVDNNVCVYEGGYYMGERWNKGISYDLSGAVEYDGEWMDNHMNKRGAEIIDLQITMEGVSISNVITELVIGNTMANSSKISDIQLSTEFTKLKLIRIGERSLQNVVNFIINGIPTLETILIGNSSFKKSGFRGIFSRGNKFEIYNCVNLVTLEMGNDCFKDYSCFSLKGLDSLDRLTIGKSCFTSCAFIISSKDINEITPYELNNR